MSVCLLIAAAFTGINNVVIVFFRHLLFSAVAYLEFNEVHQKLNTLLTDT